MKFKTGNTYGRGRPRGAKDKKWASVEYWVERMETTWPQLPHTMRAKICLEMIHLILPRRPLPTAESTQEMSPQEADLLLKALEADARNGTYNE